MQDPAVWSDAADFIPERWLGEYEGAEIHRTCSLPLVLAPEIASVNSRSSVTVGETIFAKKDKVCDEGDASYPCHARSKIRCDACPGAAA
jgi:hypothetical protein